MTWSDGELCLGVRWNDHQDATGGMPVLVLARADDEREQPLCGRLGLVVDPAVRCVGRRDLRTGRRVPCPRDAELSSGRQCSECQARDDFRFSHQAHRGGYEPDALTPYLDQPHGVYVATFADGTSKVGTASDPRRRARLLEQGPLLATYVAWTRDGRVARTLEDAVSDALGVIQFKSSAAKARGWARPAPLQQATRHHEALVARAQGVARGLLGTRHGGGRWEPPTAMAPFFRDLGPVGSRPLYPHDLRAGTHAFDVVAVAGPTALARLVGPQDDGTEFVVDLGLLRGHEIRLADVESPATTHQPSLF